jgi:hypothetical protein
MMNHKWALSNVIVDNETIINLRLERTGWQVDDADSFIWKLNAIVDDKRISENLN